MTASSFFWIAIFFLQAPRGIDVKRRQGRLRGGSISSSSSPCAYVGRRAGAARAPLFADAGEIKITIHPNSRETSPPARVDRHSCAAHDRGLPEAS